MPAVCVSCVCVLSVLNQRTVSTFACQWMLCVPSLVQQSQQMLVQKNMTTRAALGCQF